MEKEIYTLKDGFYKLLLIGVLFLLLFYNVYNLLVFLLFLSLIPMTLHTTILILIFLKHKYLGIMIKIWATLLFIGGLAGLVATVATYLAYSIDSTGTDMERLSLKYMVDWAIRLIAGIFFYIFLKDNLQKSKIEIDNTFD